MPFQLLKISPNKYFVINSKTKMKKEKQPTSLKKATAQLRILEDIEEFKNKKKISKKMSKKISGGALQEGLDYINSHAPDSAKKTFAKELLRKYTGDDFKTAAKESLDLAGIDFEDSDEEREHLKPADSEKQVLPEKMISGVEAQQYIDKPVIVQKILEMLPFKDFTPNFISKYLATHRIYTMEDAITNISKILEILDYLKPHFKPLYLKNVLEHLILYNIQTKVGADKYIQNNISENQNAITERILDKIKIDHPEITFDFIKTNYVEKYGIHNIEQALENVDKITDLFKLVVPYVEDTPLEKIKLLKNLLFHNILTKEDANKFFDIDLDTPSRPGTPEWAFYGKGLFGGNFKSKLRLYGGGAEQDQYKEYLQTHPFGELNPRSQSEINQMHDLYTQSQNYKKLTSVFGVPTIKGGLLPNEQMIEANRQSAITFEHTLSPQELPYYNYWIKFFGTDIISLWEPGLTMGKLLLYSKNRIATVSAKAKCIIHLRESNPIIPNYNYDEEQRLYLIFYNQLKTQLIAVFNPAVSNEYLHQQLNIQSLGDVEGRARTRAIIDLRQQYVSPNFSYKQAAVDEFQRQHSLVTLENQPLQDYKQGYNLTANYIKQFGASYLWNDIHLDTLPDATPYDQGVRYAVISFRAVWEYQAPPPPKKSTWDEVWDAVTTGVELGAEILKVALL